VEEQVVSIWAGGSGYLDGDTQTWENATQPC